MTESPIAIRFRNFYNGEMPVVRRNFIVLLLAVCLFAACGEGDAGNSNRTVANQTTTAAPIMPLDNVEDLGKIVRLPFEPLEATYYEFDLNADGARSSVSNAKRLVAVLLFSAENANQITNNAGTTAAPLGVDTENWFPPELIARSQETGDATLRGNTFSAKDFQQPPYVSGRLTRINDTNYFVLELLTF